MEICVYILRCSDQSYYTGITKKPIETRVGEHGSGVVDGYTARHLPVELVFVERFSSMLEAIARERQIKRWSRVKKEALIRYDYEGLPALARGRSRDA